MLPPCANLHVCDRIHVENMANGHNNEARQCNVCSMTINKTMNCVGAVHYNMWVLSNVHVSNMMHDDKSHNKKAVIGVGFRGLCMQPDEINSKKKRQGGVVRFCTFRCTRLGIFENPAVRPARPVQSRLGDPRGVCFLPRTPERPQVPSKTGYKPQCELRPTSLGSLL